MSRLVGILSVFLVLVLAMAFAAANAGHRVTLSLGFITLYQVPVTLVAFSGLFVGMMVMFATGIRTDLKVRRVLRERLAEETRQERTWIDRNQQDLFAVEDADEPTESSDEANEAEEEGGPDGGEVSSPAVASDDGKTGDDVPPAVASDDAETGEIPPP
jgi:uncharacterized integral membrane protein